MLIKYKKTWCQQRQGGAEGAGTGAQGRGGTGGQGGGSNIISQTQMHKDHLSKEVASAWSANQGRIFSNILNTPNSDDTNDRVKEEDDDDNDKDLINRHLSTYVK